LKIKLDLLPDDFHYENHRARGLYIGGKKVERLSKAEEEMSIMQNQDKTVQSDLLKQISQSKDKSASFSAISRSGQNNPGNPSESDSPTGGGPQFGLKDKGGWGKQIKGWINKYGSSVILPTIALLILAGGIYLYASQKSQPEITPSTSQEPTINLEEELLSQEEENILPQEKFAAGETVAEEEPGPETIKEIIPTGRQEEGTIVEKAVQGDGVTHLARRALKDYLQDHPQELTSEHKIYIEDYLKDSIGSWPLEVDEEVSFSEDLIKEAVDASQNLTPEQLKVLEKYSALVVSW
jgi:hypothetical protein